MFTNVNCEDYTSNEDESDSDTYSYKIEDPESSEDEDICKKLIRKKINLFLCNKCAYKHMSYWLFNYKDWTTFLDEKELSICDSEDEGEIQEIDGKKIMKMNVPIYEHQRQLINKLLE